jgi:large subunit ribosomal protein L22
MEVKAQAKYIKIAPRKVRLVVHLVRGMNVSKAVDQLTFANKRAAKPILKLVNSAIANAEHNFELDKNNLYIKSLIAGEGPIAYRWMPRAFGRATKLRKKTTHVYLILDEKVPSKKVKKEIKKDGKKISEVSKQDIKQDPSPAKVDVMEENMTREDKSAKAEPVFDVRMKGKHRNAQHQDKKESKEKGFLKKMFRRKSGS